jgi:hypothetical protein
MLVPGIALIGRSPCGLRIPRNNEVATWDRGRSPARRTVQEDKNAGGPEYRQQRLEKAQAEAERTRE